MPDYDVGKRQAVPTDQTEICNELVSNFRSIMLDMMDSTNTHGLEEAIVVWKHNGQWHKSETVEGEDVEDDLMAGGRISSSSLIQPRRDVPMEADLAGLIHTHPGIDPFPSLSDVMVLLEEARNLRRLEQSRKSDSYTFGAAKRPFEFIASIADTNQGIQVVTSEVDVDDLPSQRTTDILQDKVRSKKTAMLPNFGFDVDEEKRQQQLIDNYQEVIENLIQSGFRFCVETIGR
jgi:proteasome lid subunit RPN8/RPN11